MIVVNVSNPAMQNSSPAVQDSSLAVQDYSLAVQDSSPAVQDNNLPAPESSSAAQDKPGSQSRTGYLALVLKSPSNRSECQSWISLADCFAYSGLDRPLSAVIGPCRTP